MRGYIDSDRVKKVIFWIITSCLGVAVLCGILGVWEVADQLQINRILTSLAMIVAGSAVFYLINLAFGTPDPADDSQVVDSAFADRLRRAKEFREHS